MITAAILTPPGRGAVASIAVWGESATATLDELFSPVAGGRLVDASPGRIRFGQWHGLQSHGSAEDVVVCRQAANEIEIHCHGGQAAAQAIMAALIERGCRQAPWSAWLTRHAPRPVAAEALEALTGASTLACAAILLAQFHGALETELKACVGLMESSRERDRHEANDRLMRLAGRYVLGKHLTRPFEIVIAGKPNVGKSSLLNVLAGYERAIVFNQPGTTRDVLTLPTAIGGWPVKVIDTAGLRSGGDDLEASGIRLASDRMNAADLIVLVFDAHQRWQADDDELASRWPEAIVVHNKCDLGEPPRNARPGLAISALRGQGIDALLDCIAARLVPAPPPVGAPVPFSTRQMEAITAARHLCGRGDRRAAARRLRDLMLYDSAREAAALPAIRLAT